MGEPIERLAEFVARTQWDDVPAAVQHQTKLVLLDTLGVILAGAERPEVGALRARLAGSAGAGATVLARGWPTADARTAALLNGIAGRSIELCEGLRYTSGQAAMQVLPAVLAVGEAMRRSGRELLTALVVGYDVAGRLCAAFTPRPLVHQNGQASLLAAVAAGARLRGLDAGGISRAMRIATTLLLTPSYTDAVAGATALNVAGGMSGFAAALAPELALAGFAAQDDAVELSLGQLVGGGFRTDGLADELGARWEIMRNYFRLYACCNPIHPALDSLQAVLANLRPRPDEIERIDIATYRFASVMNNPDPPNYFASKYSLPHAAAAMVVRGSAGYAALDDTALADPTIAALRHRVGVTEDPAMTTVAPRLRPARVTVTLTDGRRASHACQSHRGDCEQPFEEAELRDKFRELAGVVLTPEGATRVEQAIDRAEHWQDADELIQLLRRHGRT
ncbi:MAG TPA: MmgE/PrpD family protein [Candidatus Sulfotelmatobacter sp.]|nr:MmgE/PrpD family protein [Candidatus Sulfotelmatobacter sp.]